MDEWDVRVVMPNMGDRLFGRGEWALDCSGNVKKSEGVEMGENVTVVWKVCMAAKMEQYMPWLAALGTSLACLNFLVGVQYYSPWLSCILLLVMFFYTSGAALVYASCFSSFTQDALRYLDLDTNFTWRYANSTFFGSLEDACNTAAITDACRTKSEIMSSSFFSVKL